MDAVFYLEKYSIFKSTLRLPQPEGWGLLRVDPERRFLPRPKGGGLRGTYRSRTVRNYHSEDGISRSAGLIPKECQSIIFIQFYSRSKPSPSSVQGMS